MPSSIPRLPWKRLPALPAPTDAGGIETAIVFAAERGLEPASRSTPAVDPAVAQPSAQPLRPGTTRQPAVGILARVVRRAWLQDVRGCLAIPVVSGVQAIPCSAAYRRSKSLKPRCTASPMKQNVRTAKSSLRGRWRRRLGRRLQGLSAVSIRGRKGRR